MLLLFSIFFSAISAATQVHKLTDSNFNSVSTGKWVVVFEASWCPYCKQFKSTVQELKNKLKGYEIGTVDIDTESALNSRFLIQKLPSVFVLHDGEAKEILPSFKVDELIDLIGTIDTKSPMFIQPFGVLGYALFYLGLFGKSFMSIVKYLQVYFPTWAVAIIGALVVASSFAMLLYISKPPLPQSKVTKEKKKQ